MQTPELSEISMARTDFLPLVFTAAVELSPCAGGGVMLLMLSLVLVGVVAVGGYCCCAWLLLLWVVNDAVTVQGAKVECGRAALRWSCSSWSGSGMTTR